jgi:hypothetical protein
MSRRARAASNVVRDSSSCCAGVSPAFASSFAVVVTRAFRGIRLRGGALRLRGGDGGFALTDLLAELPLLKAQGRFALAHLRREAFGAVLVVCAVGLKLAGRNHGEQLPARDRVALRDL